MIIARLAVQVQSPSGTSELCHFCESRLQDLRLSYSQYTDVISAVTQRPSRILWVRNDTRQQGLACKWARSVFALRLIDDLFKYFNLCFLHIRYDGNIIVADNKHTERWGVKKIHYRHEKLQIRQTLCQMTNTIVARSTSVVYLALEHGLVITIHSFMWAQLHI